ncbi:MAG: DUF3168 domain-containing protein [Hyphomicrobiaceae bacterium]|nr:DUF3168 domain-containing protein [Hyphomicrobiaceae bacterium]
MTPSTALFTAVKARLAADAVLVNRLGSGRVHDGPPRNAAFPYVALEEIDSRDASGLNARLEQVSLVIRAYTRSGGRIDAMAIAADVVGALDDAALPLAGHRLVRLFVRATEARLGRDRLTAEATIRLSALIEPAA